MRCPKRERLGCAWMAPHSTLVRMKPRLATALLAAWLLMTASARASHDSCTVPREITPADDYVDVLDNSGATTNPAEDGPISCLGGRSLDHSEWYTLTAPAGGTVYVSTCGTAYDSELVVFSAPPDACRLDTVRGCGEEVGCDANAAASFIVEPGERLLIAVGSRAGTPAGPLRFAACFASVAAVDHDAHLRCCRSGTPAGSDAVLCWIDAIDALATLSPLDTLRLRTRFRIIQRVGRVRAALSSFDRATAPQRRGRIANRARRRVEGLRSFIDRATMRGDAEGSVGSQLVDSVTGASTAVASLR